MWVPETNICKYYPHWFRRILDFQYLCRSEGEELRYLAEAMDQIHRNLFVQTMDEGTCAQWEAILRILPTLEEDLDFRRLRVLNRLALRPPFTLIFLRQKLDLIFGPGNYRVEVDYPNYTLYIETSMNNQRYFGEVSALLSIVKPCHIVYIARPRVDAGLRLAERVASGELPYNYILGPWALGEKPFVSCVEQEVLKMETAASIRPALLEHTAGFGRMCTTPASGEGYKFVKWAENGQTVSESASYTFTVSGDRALTAVFEEEKTSRLPAGYTEVEYIQGAGNVVPASAPHI